MPLEARTVELRRNGKITLDNGITLVHAGNTRSGTKIKIIPPVEPIARITGAVPTSRGTPTHAG
jgi:hypothetical protein